MTETTNYTIVNEQNSTVIALPEDLMLYVFVIAFSCVFMMCIVGFIHEKKYFKQHSSYYSDDNNRSQMTGALEYNASPKHGRVNKGRSPFKYALAECDEVTVNDEIEDVHSTQSSSTVKEEELNDNAGDPDIPRSPSNSFGIQMNAKRHRLSTMPMLHTAVSDEDHKANVQLRVNA